MQRSDFWERLIHRNYGIAQCYRFTINSAEKNKKTLETGTESGNQGSSPMLKSSSFVHEGQLRC